MLALRKLLPLFLVLSGAADGAVSVSTAQMAGADPACSVADQSTMTTYSDLGVALSAANPGDTLAISGTCSGNFSVTEPLTLEGVGTSPTLDGDGSGTVLHVSLPTAGTVSVAGLTITGGSAAEGGGILIDTSPSTVNLTDDVVTDNDASFGGAGIWDSCPSAPCPTLDVSDSTLSGNTITGAGAEGAAVAFSGEVDIEQSQITGNTSDATSNGVFGGALFLNGPATLSNDSISSNIAEAPSGSISGGVVLLDETIPASLSLTDTNVDDNTASVAGGFIEGGAIYTAGTAPITVQNSGIQGNQASSTTGTILGVGILSYDGPTTVEDSTIATNVGETTSGTIDGGAINPGSSLVLTDSTLTANSISSQTGEADGGGVWTNVPATITASTIFGNSATNGGGVFNSGSGVTFGASIVAGDTGGDCSGGDTDAGYDIDSDGSCSFGGTGSQSGVADVKLGALLGNGGPTQTMAPAQSSPAVGQIPDPTTINSVPVCGTGSTDQRGVSRPQSSVGANCDVGAVELALPVAQDESVSTYVNEALSEPPGTLQSGVQDANPGASSWSAAEVTAPTNGTLTVGSDGSFTYTPAPGFTGTDAFTYALTDQYGFTSAPATVTIDVLGLVPTKTAIISENPPASDPSMPVTFTAQVTPQGAGPALGGDVTFSYVCSGSGCSSSSGTLGTVAIDPSNDQAALTTSGVLPVGVDSITATYSGDTAYGGSSGSVIYTVDASCNTNPWPSATSGYPSVQASGPTGFYIGQSNGWWSLYTTQDSGGVKFSGTITTASARFLDVAGLKNERSDVVKLVGNNKITFKFFTHRSLDAVTFFVGCGHDVKFSLLVHGVKAPLSEIFVGNPTTYPASNPVTYNR